MGHVLGFILQRRFPASCWLNLDGWWLFVGEGANDNIEDYGALWGRY